MPNFDPTELEQLITGYAEADLTKPMRKAVVQTGIMSLDLLLGGGLAPGLTEIFGMPSAGKTALIGQIIAHNQRRPDAGTAILPSEILDQDYLENLGVDLTQLPVLKMSDVPSFLRSFDPALLVIDSLTALVPSDEDRNAYVFDVLQGLLEHMGAGQCVILTSHVRAQTSVSPGRVYRSGTQSASKRVTDMFVTRLELSREDVSPPSYVQVVKVLANVLGPPSQFVRLRSKMGFGVDTLWDLIEAAEGMEVLERRGSYYHLEDKRLGPGAVQASRQLGRDPELEGELVRRILSKLTG